MMFRTNFSNQNYQSSFAINSNSFDSTSSSVNSSSLLSAANTVFLNEASGSSSSPSPFNLNNLSKSQQKLNFYSNQPQQTQKPESFSHTLFQLQQKNIGSEVLDFELHYNKNDSRKSSNKKSSSAFGEVLFTDDNDDIKNNDDYDENEDEIFAQEDDVKSNENSILIGSDINIRYKQISKNPMINRNSLAIAMNKPSLPTINITNNQTNNNEDNISMESQTFVPTDMDQNKKLTDNKNSLSSSYHLIGTSSGSTFNDLTPQNSVSSKYTTSRSLMKLQLMKQQTEELERKEGRNGNMNHLFGSLSSSSSTIVGNNSALINSGTSNSSNVMTGNNNTMNAMNANNNFAQRQVQFRQDDGFNNTLTNNNANNNNNNNSMMISQQHDSNNNIMLSSSVSSEIIPKNVLSQVFQIETTLEFPTKYHVMQMTKNLQSTSNSSSSNHLKIKKSKQSKQIRAGNKPSPKMGSYLQSYSHTTNTNSLNIQSNQKSKQLVESFPSSDIAVLPHSASSLSDCVMQDNLSYDSQNSNWDSNIYSSTTGSSFSQADLISELADFVPSELLGEKNIMKLSANEILQEINMIEQAINLPKTLPNDDYLKVLSPTEASRPVRTSSSCPANSTQLDLLNTFNLTEENIRTILKERQKKDNHNMIERRRRFNINDRIKELGTILPKYNQGEIKQNKGSILKASVDYIKNLQYELNKTKEQNERLAQLASINQQLMDRIKLLELKVSPSTSVNAHEIKQEPNLSLYNLVTSEPTNNYFSQPLINGNGLNFGINNNITTPIANHNQNQNMVFENSLMTNMKLFNDSHQRYNDPKIQSQLLQQKEAFQTQNSNQIFEQNLTSGLSADDSKILDEILNSPMDFQQKDPMLSDLNNFRNETFN